LALRTGCQRRSEESGTVDVVSSDGSLDEDVAETVLTEICLFFMAHLAVNSELERARGTRLFN